MGRAAGMVVVLGGVAVGEGRGLPDNRVETVGDRAPVGSCKRHG